MLNEVFIVGKIRSANVLNEGKVLDLLVEYKRYYGFGDSSGFSVNTHNVYLVSNTESTKQFIDNSSKAKKPVYIGVQGLLAERKLDPPAGSDDKYGPSQIYILGRKVLQLSNEIETSECRGYFQGEIVWRDTRYNKKGTPMTKLIVKQSRQRKSRDGEEYTAYTGVPVTVFREADQVPYEVGDIAIFAGSLDSYELRDHEGVFTSNLTSFDYFGAANYMLGEDAPNAGGLTGDVLNEPVGGPKMVSAGGGGGGIADEFPDESELPF